MTNYICQHCGREIYGAAIIIGDYIYHSGCWEVSERKRRGLFYKCPKCKGTGQMNSGKTQKVLVGYEPSAVGRYNVAKYDEVSVMVTCTLCEGEGWNNKEAQPVTETKVVDWKL